ncbi:hypothetical protein EHS25_000784 [Saitozyma podzolica]|uniref:Uncharacterized protein n=1 Tax=Saitozyma podzolica TaxID=1890683 RepID=A0A427YX88_9TREE|nr:hypothetical protein EHS25_000784 [Saitozyma podzolica]
MSDQSVTPLSDASTLSAEGQAQVKQLTKLLDEFADVINRTNVMSSTLQVPAPHLSMRHSDPAKMTDLEAGSMAKSFLNDRIQQLLAMGTQLDVHAEDKDGSDVDKETTRRYHAVVKVPAELTDSGNLSADDIAKGIEFWVGKSRAVSYARAGSSQRGPSAVHDDVISYYSDQIKKCDPTLLEAWMNGWTADRAELMKRYNDTDGGHFEDWVNNTLSSRREKTKSGPLAKLEILRAQPRSLLSGPCEGDIVQSVETSLKPITTKNLRTWLRSSKKNLADEMEELKQRIARRQDEDSSFTMSLDEALQATAQRQKAANRWTETVRSQTSVRDSLIHALLTKEGGPETDLANLALTPALYALGQQISMRNREHMVETRGPDYDDFPQSLEEHQMAIVNAIASENWESAITLSQNHLTPGEYGAKWHDDTKDLPEEFRSNSHSYALSDRFGRDNRVWSGRFKIEAVDTIEKGEWTVQSLVAILRSEIPKPGGDQYTAPVDSGAAAPGTIAESSVSGGNELTPATTALESAFSNLDIETPPGSVAEGN